MYISRAEQRKVFINCLKHYGKFFVFMLIHTIFLNVVDMHETTNEFWYNMARLVAYLYLLLMGYLMLVLHKIEMVYEHKPEERYAVTYGYVIFIFCFILEAVIIVKHCR